MKARDVMEINFEGPRSCCQMQEQGQGHQYRDGFGGWPPPSRANCSFLHLVYGSGGVLFWDTEALAQKSPGAPVRVVVFSSL